MSEICRQHEQFKGSLSLHVNTMPIGPQARLSRWFPISVSVSLLLLVLLGAYQPAGEL